MRKFAESDAVRSWLYDVTAAVYLILCFVCEGRRRSDGDAPDGGEHPGSSPLVLTNAGVERIVVINTLLAPVPSRPY